MFWLLWFCGCAVYVCPPEAPREPVTVYIVDYGRHSSLVLPDTSENTLVEYAYGDWDWFALGRNKWYDVFPTLFLPTRGTLGRRSLRMGPEFRDLRRLIWCERVHEIAVESRAARTLILGLHGEFERHRESLHFKSVYALDFVHSDRAFHVFHNCNHAVAEWLRDLGCEVRGVALYANFEVLDESRRWNE
jgi:hypothetical protein